MNGKREEKGPLIRLVLLSLCFLGGVVLGQVFSRQVPDAAGEELKRYLTSFLSLEGGAEEPSIQAVLSAAVLYFRYPLAAFLLGFASIGVFLLPCAAGAFGFFLSFSVCCFTASFGPDGVLLALAVFGLRCAITLPCFFLLAVPSLEHSAALAFLSFGKGRTAVAYDREWWTRLTVVSGVLLAGMCAELMLVPWLLPQMLERLLS